MLARRVCFLHALPSRGLRARGAVGAALLVVVAATPAGAAAWLSGLDLKRHCDAFAVDADSGEAAACIAFVQGFIATGGAHDGTRDATLHTEARDSFIDRATRTRSGARLRALLADRNRYCIGDDMDVEEVVMRVSAYVAALDEESKALSERAEQIVRALVESFPCSGG